MCRDCREEILGGSASSCPRCALVVGPWEASAGGCSWCRKRTLGFDEAVAIGPYQGPIRELCLRMKRSRNAWLARPIADLLIASRGDRLRSLGASLVVPVPLHWWRQRSRGYNQAEALADQVASRLGLPVARALRRVVATPKLAFEGRKSRADLLRGAFRPRRRALIQGRTILLIDDILTTGATCGAAARALKEAGAARVVAVVAGRAEGRT